jgi:glycerol-3-phosphate acyltransferase PlsX
MITARVALDAMGGDNAPVATVAGAIEALERDPAVSVALVGIPAALEEQLGQYPRDRIQIVAATEVVAGGDAATDAVRKEDSSIRRGAELVRDGHADGLVAAGNTGAAVAASTVFMKLIPGVRRPGIAVTLPSLHGPVVLCDAGANLHCKPVHLFHYGVLAAEYAQRMLGISHPRVGLMNIGSEEGKGTSLLQETSELLSKVKHIDFVGNVEGNDVFTGQCHVIVAEGFTGNVILKTAEGLHEMVAHRLADLGKIIVASGREASAAYQRFQHVLDYSEHGGAPLLGINGLVLIAHGRSGPKAIRNAILQAARFHRSGALAAMTRDIAAVHGEASA